MTTEHAEHRDEKITSTSVDALREHSTDTVTYVSCDNYGRDDMGNPCHIGIWHYPDFAVHIHLIDKIDEFDGIRLVAAHIHVGLPKERWCGYDPGSEHEV